MEIRCSSPECKTTPFCICLCSDNSPAFCLDHLYEHLKSITKEHNVRKLLILSDEEIERKRIEDLESLASAFKELKGNLMEKEMKLISPKIQKFLTAIESSISEVEDILEYLDNDQDMDFYKRFRLTFEEILSKYKEKLKLLADEINGIEDIGILTKENAWAYQICEKEKDSDCRRLIADGKLPKFDELLAYKILWFLENFDASKPIDEYFNKTNLCDKEKILKAVAENLNQKCEDSLFTIIEMTKENKNLAQSGSNAISILVKTKCSFENRDFKGICIPQANLSYGIFYKTNFSGSDLRNCNLLCAQFLNTTLSDTILPSESSNFESINKAERINSVEFSHDGSWVAFCQSHKIKIYDSYSSKFKKEFSYNKIYLCLQVVSWSYDDKFIASSDFNGGVFIWNTWDNDVNPTNVIKFSRGIIKVAWTPNDYRIALYSSFGELKVWNFETNEIFFEEDLGNWSAMLVWSYSGKYLAYYYGNEFICVCDSATNELITKYSQRDVYSLEWIFKEKYIVSAGKNQQITIWNFLNDERYIFTNLIEAQITILNWNEKSSFLAVGNSEGSITIWKIYENMYSGHPFSVNIELYICCHRKNVECLAWSEKNNLLASGGRDGTLKVWQIKAKNSENKDQDTEETKSIRSYNESESQSTIIISYYEKLLWCSEASSFIKAEPEELKLIILNT